MKEFELAAAWVNFGKEIEKLFEKDSEVRVKCDEYETDGVYNISLYVDDTDKAEALRELLPIGRTFGNVTAQVSVYPPNKKEQTRADLIKTAFKNNKAVGQIVTVKNVMSNPLTYCAFDRVVVQYPMDNLHDLHGNVSTLYESIARDVLGDEEGICFCTDDDHWVF